MRIALVTEGTYPTRTGGVSTWCDQMVRGMPEHEWTVVGLTATRAEQAVWPMPDSVGRVVLHPMWGPLPAPARWSRRNAGYRRELQELLYLLWDAALAPDGEDAVTRATIALRGIVDLAATARLEPLLAAEGSTVALLRAWRDRCTDSPPLTVGDAVSAATILDRTLAVVDVTVGEVDLVHASGNGAPALIGLATHWRQGSPLLVSEHGVYLRERYLALSDDGFTWPERRALTAVTRRMCEVVYREADAVLPVSDFNRRWVERLGAAPERVVTIRNGVQPERYEPITDEPAVPTLSWVGRIDPLKDLHTLVRAFGLVRAEVPAARLRLFGPVPAGNETYRDSVVELVAELGLDDVVSFEGPVDSSRPAIAAGSVVVLSSVSEGLPFTVVEAMMCGRPTVSTDVGGVVECLDDERHAGIVVPSGDPEAFAEACVDLLRDPERRREMGAAARRHALEHGTLDRAIEAYRSAYRTASGSAPSAGSLPVPRGSEEDQPNFVVAGSFWHGSDLVGVRP
jgi:glycosyltransferase involved in cell wall biosynthesis